MIKSDKLIRLEEVGIFFQDSKGGWYNGYENYIDLTDMLLEAGMFEH